MPKIDIVADGNSDSHYRLFTLHDSARIWDKAAAITAISSLRKHHILDALNSFKWLTFANESVMNYVFLSTYQLLPTRSMEA